MFTWTSTVIKEVYLPLDWILCHNKSTGSTTTCLICKVLSVVVSGFKVDFKTFKQGITENCRAYLTDNCTVYTKITVTDNDDAGPFGVWGQASWIYYLPCHAPVIADSGYSSCDHAVSQVSFRWRGGCKGYVPSRKGGWESVNMLVLSGIERCDSG